jgi:hypothetical protein
VDAVERVLHEGEAITAPAGSAHAAWNAGDGEVHALVDFTGRLPGPRRPSRPWRVWRATGRPTGREPPRNPLMLALVLREFEEEIYFVSPPLFVQRIVFGALAGVVRLLGYRAEYP